MEKCLCPDYVEQKELNEWVKNSSLCGQTDTYLSIDTSLSNVHKRYKYKFENIRKDDTIDSLEYFQSLMISIKYEHFENEDW